MCTKAIQNSKIFFRGCSHFSQFHRQIGWIMYLPKQLITCMPDHSVVLIKSPCEGCIAIKFWIRFEILTSGAPFVHGLALSAAPGLLLSCGVVLSGCHGAHQRRQLSWRLGVCGAHRGSVTDNRQYSVCAFAFVCVRWENTSEIY